MRRSTSLKRESMMHGDALVAWLLIVLVAAPTAPAAELITDASDHEKLASVLVSRRKEAKGPRRTALEPISQVSDREPELAEPHEAGFKEPGKAQERGATASRPREPKARIARRVEESSGGANRAAGDSSPRPAKFLGIRPGQTTRLELTEAWGDPAREMPADTGVAGDEVLTYDTPPFRGVDALVHRGVVRAIRVSLSERSSIDDLIQRLELEAIDPVEVTDPDSGALLGVTFPERGLTLLAPDTISPSDDEVDQIILQTLDSKAFAARAESRSANECEKAIADLEMALRVDPENAHAFWLEAGVRRSVGQADRALKAASEAVRLKGRNAAYRLRLAECLAGMAAHDRAVLETRRVLDDPSAPEVVRAQALYAMGGLASLGDEAIAAKTIGFHTAAIEIADTLATSSDDRERWEAKRVLVDAHLAVAREIARRDYGNKVAVVGEWIGRASGLAEEWIESDGGGLELRLRIAREALGALASLRPAKDPTPWIREAEQAAKTILASSDDALFRSRVEWELGEAYQHAVRIEHARGSASKAFDYGEKAIERLSRSAEPRVSAPDSALTVAKLYFYIGAANAIHLEDHEEAVFWYEKARPILTADRPVSEFVVPRREGETMVSMAVSYWNQGDKMLAVDLTNRGARLMRQSVSAKVSKADSLGVPYGNLAGMHRNLGNTNEADRFRKMAASARGAAPRTAGATANPERTSVARRSSPSASASSSASNQQATPRSTTQARGVLARRPSHRQTRMR